MLLTTLFTCLMLVSTTISSLNKCCGENQQLFMNATDFSCIETSEKRLEIVANVTNQLNQDTCYEIYNSTFFTKVASDGNVAVNSSLVPLDEYFRKCCPLNHVYDRRTHGCVEVLEDNTYFGGDLVKIGLPECKTIRDYSFQNQGELSKRISELNGDYCVDKDENDEYVLRVCENSTEICNDIKCVMKCCPDGQSFVGGANCRDTLKYGLDLNFSRQIVRPEDEFAIVHKYTCNRIFVLNESKYDFSLNSKGALELLEKNFEGHPLGKKTYDYNMRISYCIEHARRKKGNLNGFQFFMCFPEYPKVEKFEFTKWAKIASCIGLVLTISIYIILNKTQNLFGKSLVTYCISAFIVLILLLHAQFTENINDTDCIIVGYFLMFSIVSEFSWLNVICWDIWYTFSFPKTTLMSSRQAEWKKFLYYNLYAWGISLFLTLLILIFNTFIVLPFEIHPFIGKNQCFLERREGNYARILFKDGPLLVMEIANTVLFLKTVVYCLKVKNEISKVNDVTLANRDKKNKFNTGKEQLILIFKLSILMGLLLLFEVISGFFDMSQNKVTKYIEIVWDTVNCLEGVFIFIIFICKKSMYNELQNKFGIRVARKASATSMTNV